MPGKCGEAGTKGWRFASGQLLAPTPGLCADGSRTQVGGVPTTRGSGGVTTKSGVGIRNLSALAKGAAWAHNATFGALAFTAKAGADAYCAGIQAAAPFDPDAGSRKSDLLGMWKGWCARPNPEQAWDLTPAGELRARDGAWCVADIPPYGVQLWAKPQPGGKVAVLALNPLDEPQALAIPLADVPGQPCAKGACAVRDVWGQKDAAPQADHLAVDLAVHESVYYVLTPP